MLFYIDYQVGLRCHSKAVPIKDFAPQPHQGRTSPRFCLRIYPSPAHIKPSAAASPRVGVAPESVKLLIGVHYNMYSPLARASSFATGRGSPYYLQCRPTSTRITKARRPLSLLLGMRDIHSYPQARYFIPRLFSLPNCDLSIAAV